MTSTINRGQREDDEYSMMFIDEGIILEDAAVSDNDNEEDDEESNLLNLIQYEQRRRNPTSPRYHPCLSLACRILVAVAIIVSAIVMARKVPCEGNAWHCQTNVDAFLSSESDIAYHSNNMNSTLTMGIMEMQILSEQPTMEPTTENDPREM